MSVNGVAADTLVLTSEGYLPVKSLPQKQILVWNSEEFTPAEVHKIATTQQVLRCVFNNGIELECSPDFIFRVQKYYSSDQSSFSVGDVSLEDLSATHKIIKRPYPLIEYGTKDFPYAYTHGFYSGAEKFKRKRLVVARSAVYGMRRPALEFLELDAEQNQKISLHFPSDIPPDFEVPLESGYSLETRLLWLAGLFDSGLIKRKIRPTAIWDVYSENLDFLRQVQLLLHTLGVESRVIANSDLGRAHYTLRIAGVASQILRARRVPMKNHFIPVYKPRHRSTQFPSLQEVIDDYNRSDLYVVTQQSGDLVVMNGLVVPNNSV